MLEKLLPQNIEAEYGVLGSILIGSEAIEQVIEYLRPDDFYRSAHSTIYHAMLKLYEQHEPIDFITLADALEKDNKLEGVGGYNAILNLTNEVPTSWNIDAYARIVSKCAMMRRLVHVAGQIAALAYEQTDNALDQSERLLFSLSSRSAQNGFRSLSEIMLDYMNELDMLQNTPGALTGVPCGYKALDRLTNGLQKTDLIILAGRPGSGKTSFGTNIAYNAAREGKHVAVFSLEMGNRQLARRLMSMDSGVDMQRLRSGFIEDNEWEAVTNSGGKLGDLPIWINDTSDSPISSMRAQLRRLIQDHGVDLVVVDYLQLMDAEDDGKNHENRVQVISEISRGLKRIAKEFDVPVLALAQLSRKVEERAVKIPMLSDLREGGSIENDADIVLFIYRDDYYAELEKRESKRPNVADIYIAKHRNGPVGMISLYFKADQTKFFNLEATQE
jgi:replicative DNA helicase